jgi:hypothetical protein
MDSARILARFPEAALDGKGRPKALHGPQEYRVTVGRGKDTLAVLPGMRARESSP